MVPVRRQMWPLSFIFTVIASPPKQPKEFWRNLAYEFLSMSRYVRPKISLVHQQIWPKTNIGQQISYFLKSWIALYITLNNLVIASPPRFLKLVWDWFSTSGLVVSSRKWLQSIDKYEPSLINIFITFSLDLPGLYCQEFDKTSLLVNNNYSIHATGMAIQGS